MTLPVSRDFSSFFSEATKARKLSPLKAGMKYFSDPNLIFLAGGLPLSEYFPWNDLTATSPVPPFMQGIGASPEDETANTLNMTIKKYGVTREGDIPLEKSLQYGNTPGQPEFLSFLREHTELIHKMKYSDWDLSLTVGNTFAWDCTLRLFCNPGDVILAEGYSFPTSIQSAEAQGTKVFPISIDDKGIIPDKLAELLDGWPSDITFPKLLYTIPTGQNPTCSCLPDERRVSIYKIAQKHNLLIIEDEPYYFLQMPVYTRDPGSRRSREVCKRKDQFLNSLAKTFLSLDTDGRVIRLDSFSKVLAPGTRLGWVTGSKHLIQKYVALHEATIQFACGFSESIVGGTLNRWGQDGYLDWLIGLRHEYSSKRDNTMDALYDFLPQNPAFSAVPPTAGMFFTVKIDPRFHPHFTTTFSGDYEKFEDAIYEKFVKKGVLVAKGSWFKVAGVEDSHILSNDERGEKIIFFRGTYAAVPPEKLRTGIRKLCETLIEEFQLE